MNRHAVVLALLSAGLFGVSTPAAKALLGTIDPAILAGLLYCGAGLGVAMLRRAGRRLVLIQPGAPEVPLKRQHVPWLVGAIVSGGIVGPVLLMTGLARTDAAAASLLLSLEGAATALMAWVIFGENFDRRIALGIACLVAGGAVLAWSERPTWSGLIGPLAIVGACTAWGLDNNLTRKVSLLTRSRSSRSRVSSLVPSISPWVFSSAAPFPAPQPSLSQALSASSGMASASRSS
jgi:drug/metabolite transporter (DMT)-like permease